MGLSHFSTRQTGIARSSVARPADVSHRRTFEATARHPQRPTACDRSMATGMLGADSVPLGATELCAPARLVLSIICAIRRSALFRQKFRHYSSCVALHACLSAKIHLETRFGTSRDTSSAENTHMIEQMALAGDEW